MKPRCAGKLFGALLLVGILTSGFECQALPPRQHAVRGVVESVDHAKRTLVLVEPKAKTTRVFVWTDSTRLRQDGKKAAVEALRVGMEVKGYYRKEVGQFVLRELRWSSTAARINETATQLDLESARLCGANNSRKP